MRNLILSLGIGLVSGVICFFLSVAFLIFVLLIVGAFSHSRPDMTLTYRVAAPVALLAAISGFTITLVRGLRSAAHRKSTPETRRHGEDRAV
jgi:predicted RND superfamily exporter protein